MALLSIGAAAAAAGGALSFKVAASSSFITVSHTHFSRTGYLSAAAAAAAAAGPSLSLSATTLSVAAPVTAPYAFPLSIYCGRGDKKTAKGKRFRHSFGNCRPRNKKKGRGPPRAPMPPSPLKKEDEFDDGDGGIGDIEIDESLFS